MAKSSIQVENRTLTVSNLDKVLYPEGRFTKAQVIDYYARVSAYLLPHFKNRPVTLVRFPDGVKGESFYEKNAPKFTPDWVETFPVPRNDGEDICYILINDLPTLTWTANLAALELHPFLHRAPKINQPTHVVFDLDPGEGATILTCGKVALLLRELMESMSLEIFPKVSGSKGLQIYIPLNTPTSYEKTHAFARGVAEHLEKQHPHLILSAMAKHLRKNRVFIDWSQNNQKKTTAGVYSLRAKRDHPTVSLPVSWDEISSAMKKNDPERLMFGPEDALERLERLGDLFEPVLTLKQNLPRSLPEPGGADSVATTSKRTAPARATTRKPKTGSQPKKTPLREYAAKRDFSVTAEPEPSSPAKAGLEQTRRFVVQKHAASRLHYDFRLEMDGVLKSWAVPKGVPIEPGEKRGAFATEDHPIGYLEFEGIIPQGQYGGGTVMVWDIGTYNVDKGDYDDGLLTFHLRGKKLDGQWTLKRLNPDEKTGKTSWLLMKTGGPARRILKKDLDRSAISGRTLDQIAADKSAVWQSDRPSVSAAHKSTDRLETLRRDRRTAAAHAAPEPKFVPPMKATLVTELPEGPEWMYEIKWDGYRALASKHGDSVRLLSLRNNDLTAEFPRVVDAVRAIHARSALLDGEIVAVDDAGQPSFQALQNRSSLEPRFHIVFYAFDLLSLEEEDLRKIPLEARRERLRTILPNSGVRFSSELTGSPSEIAALVKRAGLEGVVAKHKESTYHGGIRTRQWLKVKFAKAQEFVIGGYHPDGKNFHSILVGYYQGAQFKFAGKVRQGFNPASRAKLFLQLRQMETDRCPFTNLPLTTGGRFGVSVTKSDMQKMRWIRPELVAQIHFTEWTASGLLRGASYQGLRDEKEAGEVVAETGPAATTEKARAA